MAGVKATASAAANNWGTGFGAAGPKYEAGIDAVTVAPGILASQQVGAYVQGVQNSQKIWAAKVAAVDLNTWKNQAKTVGSQRLASGATKGQPKVNAFFQAFLPDLANIVNGLPNRGSFEQNMQRSMAFATALHQKKGSY